MADGTGIEWTDATWNPITGCSVVSPGCTNCYAMKLAGTRLAHHPSRQGLTIDTKAGPVWTGEVRFNEQWLTQPIQWKRPRQIFVCAHGDLFHENVPDEWIDKVFAVTALAPQHVYQVLTKRNARMRRYFHIDAEHDCIERIGEQMGAIAPESRASLTFPFPNVWLGVSAEDQTRADERIPDLLATPAAVRWVSYEPALGPLNIADAMTTDAALRVLFDLQAQGRLADQRGSIHWIVCGAESGRGARHMPLEWAQSALDQCSAANVAFFMKQLSGPAGHAVKDIEQFPKTLRVREMPR